MTKYDQEYKRIWVTPETHHLVKLKAVKNNITMGELIKRLLSRRIENDRKMD